MHRNRLFVERDVQLPLPPPPPPTPGGFVLCPMFWVPGMTLEQILWQQWVYRCALEQAQAVLRPSILERDLLAVWN
jgi:hypothetical protein